MEKIPFETEITIFLKNEFFESWMDEDDWNAFLFELEKHSGVSIKSLSDDLQDGFKNGVSVSEQLQLASQALNDLKNGN